MMDIFAEELREAGRADPGIVALSADVRRSTGLGLFAEAFPERYYEMGVSEQNMIGTAAGAALEGRRAVASSYACFSPGRTWEQIRNAVCHMRADVKIIGAHAGVGSGRDGATHQCFEDIALMSCLPGMTIYSPATESDVRLAARQMLAEEGPAYLRLSARPCPEPEGYEAGLDQPVRMKDGKDFAVIGTGGILAFALEAAERFAERTGMSAAVYNVVRLKPFSLDAIAGELAAFRAVLSVEEHQRTGGFGSLCASVMAERRNMPPLYRAGVDGVFGESMEPDALYRHLGISAEDLLAGLERMKEET